MGEHLSVSADIKANRGKAPCGKHILVLANPTATSFRFDYIHKIVELLSADGHKVDLKLTERAIEIAETSADPNLDVDIIAVAGGDASISEAACSLLERGIKPDLAIIPCGTANVLAHELHIPRSPEAIAKMIAQAKIKMLHNGYANGRAFFLSASTGFEAEVVHVVPLSLKRRFGKLAYLYIAIQLAFSRRHSHFRIRADGRDLTCAMAFVTNSKYYAGKNLIAPEASVLEKGLYLIAFRHDSMKALLLYTLRLLTDRLISSKNIEVIPVSNVRIDSFRAAAVQIDGEPFGGTPLEINVGTHQLSVVVP